MQRRQFLGTVGGSFPLVLAGCVTADGDSAEHREVSWWFDIPDDPESLPIADGERPVEDWEAIREFEAIHIGQRQALPDNIRPHVLRLINREARSQLRVGVFDTVNEQFVVHADISPPVDEQVRINLHRPSFYILLVAANGLDHELKIPCIYFDCNSSATTVGVFESEIRSSLYTTLAGCPSYENCP